MPVRPLTVGLGGQRDGRHRRERLGKFVWGTPDESEPHARAIEPVEK
jgi:hypothetical protein